jgi:hydrophobe/amphiphile efflux-1 (HAE1) family protein
MSPRFFIDRPIFSSVISIVIVLVGLLALFSLPIEQYPNITPPLIQVSSTYTGANAETMSDTVAAPLEQQINGTENMIYMSSQNSANGSSVISIYFDIGTEIEQAQINVQNAVNLAMPQLPEEVKRMGVVVNKQTPNILMVIAVQSPTDRFDDIFISNYANLNIVDDLKRIKGMSAVNIIGARDYSMRIWLRPDRMAQLELATTDIVNAIREQNALFAVGQIGKSPNAEPVDLTLSVTTLGRLSKPEEFENIILRANEDGSMVLLKDVARVELGAQSYDVNAMLNGKSTVSIACYPQYGANALQVGQEIKDMMAQLSKSFPQGIEYTIPYDTTNYVKRSIREVATTFFEAALLVILVVWVFLQSFRATLIPILAIVVSIIGAFAGMYMMGFSLNTLTLFGLVLAIGIVVDDAIVVIENVERIMREAKLSAKEAAVLAMEEVTGPVIATTLVLCAVFIPVAFMGGIAGQLYKQFAITITISVVVSSVVALTLSPSIAALILKPEEHPPRWARIFNGLFSRFTEFYMKGASWIIHRRGIGMGMVGGILLLIMILANTVPTSFVPEEDQGYLFVIGNLPSGASLERTSLVSKEILNASKNISGVNLVVSLDGFSLLDGLNRTDISTSFIVLKDWGLRTAPSEHSHQILDKLRKLYTKIPEANIVAFNPPAIPGLGTVGGFEFWIQNRGGGDIKKLEEITKEFMAKARARPELTGIFTTFQTNTLQLFVNLDRFKTRSLGVQISDVFSTLQSLLGSLYVNDFNKFGRVFKVMIQAEPSYRKSVSDIGDLYVRSVQGNMIPLKSLIDVEYSQGPSLVSRFNGFVATKINGGAAPGYSSGEAMDVMEMLAKEVLPGDMSYSWSGQSYQEKKSGGSSMFVFLGGLIGVFLILSALYERWSLPLAIVAAVPFGVFGAFFAVWWFKMSNDVYFQVGLVTLIGLAAKNAILIVEFAAAMNKAGMPIIEAALKAAKMRFRAIIMTSLTFIFGTIPLVFSSGAGAASRQSVGTGVMGGMIAATFLAIFFVPLFYRLIEEFSARRSDEKV